MWPYSSGGSGSRGSTSLWDNRIVSIFDLHVHLFPKGMFEALWHYFESRDWPVHHEQVDQIEATLIAPNARMSLDFLWETLGLERDAPAGTATA